jgi:sulfide dehydrogenase cytochrome subunit
MKTITSRKILLATATWALVVVLGGTAVLSISAHALANNLKEKVPPALDEKEITATTNEPTGNATEEAGEMLAHSCAACHGTLGRLGDESFMPLAGMPVGQFVNTMVAFREGQRPATLMGHVARGFSDADIRAMGVFFAGVAPAAEGQK